MEERLSVLEENNSDIMTKEHSKKYFDSVRQCCMELLSFNVGVKQVEPVIKSVLTHLTSIKVDSLPKKSTLANMAAEMKCVAYQQLADELCADNTMTLHSDGTSKFGQHYVGYQLSTENSAYSLGLSEMLTGTAEQTLSTLKQILSDIDLVAGEGAGERIVACIKNTMSDRHIVQKNFNCLLEDYRAQILPSVISNWSSLSEEEQVKMCTLNSFFCGMHLLVGFADTASSTLLQWEVSNTAVQAAMSQCTSVLLQKSESGTVRLIRTACKAFSKHASEKSGVYQHFTSFVLSKG